MDFGEQLRLIRLNNNLSQVEFAKVLGISSSYLSQIEKGRQGMGQAGIKKSAEALKISVEALLFLAIETPPEMTQEAKASFEKIQQTFLGETLLQIKIDKKVEHEFK